MSTRFQPIIRVFVSSTFGDLQKERNILQADVFPALERHCAEREFQFQAIDLRWGVPGEAGLGHRTMRICFDELRRSQEVSPKPNFLVLLGARYGWQPIPEEISEKEHADLERAAAELERANPPRRVANAREVLAQWYRRDENAIPSVHLLCSRYESPDGRDYANPVKNNPKWESVQQVLWAVVNQAYPAKDRANRFARIPKLSEPLPSIVKFQASATEQEIWRGALAVEDASEHVVAWFRDIREREQYRSDKRAEDFFDREFFQGDDAPRQAAQELRQALERKLSKVIRPATVGLRESAENQRVEVTDHHLPEMCRYIQNELTRIIDQEINEYWKLQKPIASNTQKKEDSAAIEPDLSANPLELRKLELEQQAHERFGAERGANFVGREQELAVIANYLDDEDRKPLVVYGPSGTGKTALLARASMLAENGKREVITRYLGITPRCSTLRDLLVNLCHELSEPGTAPQALPTEMTALQAEFDRLLVAAGRLQPVVLFLDALDQLDPTDNAQGTYWLRSPLPPGVKTVVSCLWDPDLDLSSDEDDDEATNAPLRESARANQPYLSLQSRQLLDRAIAVESLTATQARELLERWLTNGDVRRPEKRMLTAAQWKAVEGRICSPGATPCRRPLYLRVLFEGCRLWPSWKAVVSEELGEDTSAELRKLLHRLSGPSVHGKELVSAALGYLAAARRGLSENELLEVLWADPQYKAHLEQASVEFHHELPRGAKRIPIALWSRLRFDLDPYLAEQAAPGATVVHFYHRQVARAVAKKYLTDGAARLRAHKSLADYFKGQQEITPRLLSELPWQCAQGALFDDLEKALTDVDIFLGLSEMNRYEIWNYWQAMPVERQSIVGAYNRAIGEWERILGKTERLELALNELEHFYYVSGEKQEYVRLTHLSYDLAKQLYDDSDIRLAIRTNNLSSALFTEGKFEEALSLALKAEPAYEQNFTVYQEDRWVASSNIAHCLMQLGRFAEAEDKFRSFRDEECRYLGAWHPRTLTTTTNLASLLQCQGRFSEATPLFEEAATGSKTAFGEEHPATKQALEHVRIHLSDFVDADPATALMNLVGHLDARGITNEAARRIPEALERIEAGTSHGSETTTSLPSALKGGNNFAAALRKRGLVSQAEPIDRRIVAMTEKVLGANHPLTLHRRNNLVLTLILLSRLAEAYGLLQQNWHGNAEPFANTKPRVAFLAYIIKLLEAQSGSLFIGQLKTLLTGAELPIAPGITVPWDIAYFIDQLRPRLHEGSADFLTSLIAAMNDRSKLPELDRYLEWRDQPAIRLDTPWPNRLPKSETDGGSP